MGRLTVICCLLLLAACAPLPTGTEPGARWLPSPNFDQRRPNFVIIHATTNDTAEQALRTLTDPARKVSAHYLVGRDGSLTQLVDERDRAWHAGESYWGGQTDLNSAAIGIELDNTGREPFAEGQIATLLTLLTDLRRRYPIPAANVLAHGDVAPRRKSDPGPLFPWKTLAAHGFGLWCEPPYPPPPAGFDSTLALQALGYDVSDREAARRAFRRHFLAGESGALLDDGEQALLRCLVQAKARGAAAAGTGAPLNGNLDAEAKLVGDAGHEVPQK